MGILNYQAAVPFPRTVDLADQKKLFPIALSSSLRVFWDIRNQVAHSTKDFPAEELLRIIDIGTSIIMMLDGIPHETNVIQFPSAKVFADADGTWTRKGVHAVVLNTTGPGGVVHSTRVFPTKRTDSKAGQKVSWSWDMSETWGESWYEDPEDHSIKYGWTSSAEFAGSPIPDDRRYTFTSLHQRARLLHMR